MARKEEHPPAATPTEEAERDSKRHLRNRQRNLSACYSSSFSDTSTSSTCADAYDDAPPPPSADHLLSLVADLDSEDPRLQLAAASELRLLAKHSPDNRLRIAKAGAALPLVSLLSSDDLLLQEHATTALLNLALLEVNRPLLAAAGAITALSLPLRDGTPAARANAAAALLRLSQLPSLRSAVARSGALPLLVDLLRSRHARGQKDAATTLYALCSGDPDARLQAVRAGLVRPLLDMLAAGEPGIADKAAYLLAVVAPCREAREDLLAERGVPVLVEAMEEGSSRQREAAADVLLRLCEESAAACRSVATLDGAVPVLAALSRSGTDRAKKKAEMLLELLMCRAGNGRVLDVPAEQYY